MVNEWDEVYVEADENLPLQLLGDIWSTFKLSIPELHFDMLNSGLNYILLSYPDSVLPAQITDILVDESVLVSTQKQHIWSLIVDNIMDLLRGAGFTLSSEFQDDKYLFHYISLVELLFTLPGYEDTVGIGAILSSLDADPKDRIIQTLVKIHGENYDTEAFEYIIETVSEVLLKSLNDGLTGTPEIVNPPKNIIDRVLDNKAMFENTLTWTHIVNHGTLGGTVEGLLTFFKGDLLRVADEEGMLRYGVNVVCLFFISELNNEQLKDAIAKYLDEMIDDIKVRMQLDQLMTTFNLRERKDYEQA